MRPCCRTASTLFFGWRIVLRGLAQVVAVALVGWAILAATRHGTPRLPAAFRVGKFANRYAHGEIPDTQGVRTLTT